MANTFKSTGKVINSTFVAIRLNISNQTDVRAQNSAPNEAKNITLNVIAVLQIKSNDVEQPKFF